MDVKTLCFMVGLLAAPGPCRDIPAAESFLLELVAHLLP